MSRTVTLGLACKTYILATGSRASWGSAVNGIHTAAAPASLTEFDVIRDVKLNVTGGEADVSMRYSDWELVVMALKKGDVELHMPWVPGDTNFQKLIQAWAGRTSVALALLDGDKAVSGSQGLWADFTVTEIPIEQNLDKNADVTFKVKPTPSAVAPEWVQVA